MNHQPDVRAVIDGAFSNRSVAGLSRLLGFAASAVAVPDTLPLVRSRADALANLWSLGARGTLTCYQLHFRGRLASSELLAAARALRAMNYAQLQLYIAVDSDYGEITVASFGLGEHLLTLPMQRDRVHPSDVEAIAEMIPAGDERGSALAARHGRALDRSRVTSRFFIDFAAQRDLVAHAWSGVAVQQRRDREQLALLLLSRLMFLYFLQHRGYLGGDSHFLVRRFRAWRGRPSFYTGALKPLFFNVLNRRPVRRVERAKSFGDLPYLNGGLFERHSLERKHHRLDLGNASLGAVFDDLLERYRFTAREVADAQAEGVQDVGVDPEMLGRVFEGLMAKQARATTGTFYTPAGTVDRLVCNTLVAQLAPRITESAASALIRDGQVASLDVYQRRFTSRLLRETRILDPACGSGAFLLGALSRIAQARVLLDDTEAMPLRRETVARSLYGVDLQSDAALLCALRLWLALVPGDERQRVQPLPNLDRQIRQGDSLIDPLDLRAVTVDAEIRRYMAELQPASAAYVHSEPEQRPALQRALTRTERRLARAWVNALQRRTRYETAELKAAAHQKDLFGGATEEAKAAALALIDAHRRSAALQILARDIRTRDDRPFFSFGVHFPDATLQGFDVVLCNPPWIRSHKWPRNISQIVRTRFDTCRINTWQPPGRSNGGSAGGNQVDLALLFLERAIELLAPGGALGIILPAKFMRSLSGASARRLLIERTEIVSVEDHSLDQRSIFAADAFAALIVARKRDTPRVASSNPVHVTCIRRGKSPLAFAQCARDLPLFDGDPRAPWLLVPPDVRRALLRMHERGMIGTHRDLQIHRGIVTGANHVMLLARADSKLGNLAAIQAEGFASAPRPDDFVGVVEQSAVARAARGSDIAAWTFRPSRFVLCRRPATSSRLPRLEKFLQKHNRALADVPAATAPRTMIAWHDLASTLKAVVMPPDVVPINTVYFIPVEEDCAHVLAAYFNSRPMRTFARAVAERAKDAHFRFFAWTMALLPLPVHWRTFEAKRLVELSRAGHARGALDAGGQAELDALIATAFGLTRADVCALESFDAWLSA